MLASRRAMLGWTAAVAGNARLSAAPPGPPLTPPEMMGPFYPRVTSRESTIDMTRVPGGTGRALGEPVDLVVTVRDRTGAPVRGAIVLAWHASAAGVYGHPRDLVKLPPDPNFLGHALLRTDRDGVVRIGTVKPGAYPDVPGRLRTPHIHFEVIGEESRLITQMYFPGEPLNGRDRLIDNMVKAGRDPRALTCRALDGVTGRYQWDVVLERA